MFQPLHHRLAGLATLAALLSAGSALAQSVPAARVRIFEEPPPMELLRSIMVPESRSGLTHRIVLSAPDQPSPLTSSTATSEHTSESDTLPSTPRRHPPPDNAARA